MDPRLYQIVCLAGLLLYGLVRLDFDIAAARVALILATVLLTQWACSRAARLPRFDPRSALISGLSLCLLLRVDAAWLAVIAAAIAVASKFVVRVRDKHVFNPTNLAIVVLLVATDRAWVSPGQWGSTTVFAFMMAAAGTLVVTRAARADVTLAFLAAHAAIGFGRALWLGQPLAAPIHRLENGALVLFAFFMISDPKTTPDSRAGRVVFALLVALGANAVQFLLFRTNGLLWSLAALSLLVPLIDRWLPGRRYTWSGQGSGAVPIPARREIPMQRIPRPAAVAALLLTASPALVPGVAGAFCGFYVAQADAKLFNKSSQVVLVRDDDRTVMTMGNDFKGDLREFAIVVPVPTVLERDQIHVGDQAVIDHLDRFSAPRLVEYFDPDPCEVRVAFEREMSARGGLSMLAAPPQVAARKSAVVIEASYTIGEYDILILSAKESHGLELWLQENGYRVPAGAARVLGAYLKQGMKFFVAKVNLKEQQALGFTRLRPLQMAYENAKFMLPIRLGMVNADGAQEIFVYALTRNGRVEPTNYRTVRLPTDQEIPPYVKGEFAAFYRDFFARQVEREGMRTVFLEYAWDMASCDPCASEPLSVAELRGLGVFWLADGGRQGPQGTFVTRLHARYDKAHFPEDLVFQVTGDRTPFQGRYVLRHAFAGACDCDAGRSYKRQLRDRQTVETRTLVELTGWDLATVRARAGIGTDADPAPWWRDLWQD